LYPTAEQQDELLWNQNTSNFLLLQQNQAEPAIRMQTLPPLTTKTLVGRKNKEPSTLLPKPPLRPSAGAGDQRAAAAVEKAPARNKRLPNQHLRVSTHRQRNTPM
jgi:hypothetical protein